MLVLLLGVEMRTVVFFQISLVVALAFGIAFWRRYQDNKYVEISGDEEIHPEPISRFSNYFRFALFSSIYFMDIEKVLIETRADIIVTYQDNHNISFWYGPHITTYNFPLYKCIMIIETLAEIEHRRLEQPPMICTKINYYETFMLCALFKPPKDFSIDD